MYMYYIYIHVNTIYLYLQKGIIASNLLLRTSLELVINQRLTAFISKVFYFNFLISQSNYSNCYIITYCKDYNSK